MSLGETIFGGLGGGKKGQIQPKGAGKVGSEDEAEAQAPSQSSSARSGVPDRRVSANEATTSTGTAAAEGGVMPLLPLPGAAAESIGLPPIPPRRHSRVLSGSSEGFDIPDAMLTGARQHNKAPSTRVSDAA